jgi:cbb3-type cytochrome oxidase maturation protein
MEALFLLIPLSLIFIGAIAAVLYWAIQSGQYDDLEKPGHQVLLDDDDAGAHPEPPPGDAPDQR